MNHIGQVKIDNGLKMLVKIEHRGVNETETWAPLVEYLLDNMVHCVDIPGVGKYNWTMRELMKMDEEFRAVALRMKELKP